MLITSKVVDGCSSLEISVSLGWQAGMSSPPLKGRMDAAQYSRAWSGRVLAK